jgi:hypothetical protein
MSKERPGKGKHHPTGRSEKPQPFNVVDHETYNALPDDVRQAVADLYPHFDQIATRLQTSGYDPPDEMVRRVVSCLDKRLGPVRKFLSGRVENEQSERERALSELPDDIANVIRHSRNAAALQGKLQQLLETYPDAERDAIRTRIFTALGMKPSA